MLQPLLHHRALRLALGAVLAFALLATSSARADVAQVTVVSPGGAQQTLALEALAGGEDVVAKPYVLRSSGGETTLTLTGFTPAALIEAAGADPYGFSYLEVQRPGGGTVLLSRTQALGPSAFPEGPPVIYAGAGGTGFLRPSGGADDANATDSFEAPQGVTLVMRKGSALAVEAKSSTVRTEVGEPVRFSAAVTGAGAGEQLVYSWYFDDGGSSANAEATHHFKQPGSYDVVLGVTTDGDEAGASDVVTVQVGAPIAGPDRKGGGRSEAANAPDHGAAAGPSRGSDGGSGAVGTTPTPAPTPTPTPAATTPAPATAVAAPSVPRAKERPRPQPAGTRVAGELVSAATAPPPEREPRAEARRGSLAGEGAGGSGVPAAAWGGLATIGLLGLGGLLEARGLAGLLPQPRRRGVA